MSSTDLASQIGGLLGLFAGASIITMAEFVDIGLVCLVTFLRARLQRSKQVSDGPKVQVAEAAPEERRQSQFGADNRKQSIFGPQPTLFGDIQESNIH